MANEEDINTRIAVLEHQLVSAIARHDELRDLDAHALQLQATEYERRLDALNNENDRLSAMQRTYVSYSVLAGIMGIIIGVVALWLRHGGI